MNKSGRPAGAWPPWMQEIITCVACSLVVGFSVLAATTNSPLRPNGPNPKISYYNLLAQGLFEGHLYVKRDVPAGLARLANPYDPTANAAYTPRVLDLSYYKGKLYLYFGITPALVLFCPYHALTGSYLSERTAIAFLFALGFAAALWLGRALCQRYFPEIKPWTFTACALGLGLGISLAFTSGIYEHKDWRVSGNVYEVAIIFAFAFTMLALVGIWQAIHADTKRRALWLLLASFAYGLAVGSRPSILFGATALFIPVVQAWRLAGAGSRRQTALLFAAAAGPIALIGSGLMLYNDLRFGNPFDFGWRYQINGLYNATTAHQLSLRYFWFSFQTYFTQPLKYGSHFPFFHAVPLPPPAGHYNGPVGADGGVLWRYPLALLALAVPLAWRGSPAATASSLRWFAVALLCVFTTSSLLLCLFFAANGRYELDFLPAMMLLSLIGFSGVKRAVLPSFPGALFVRWGWRLILSYSVIFSLIVSVISNVQSHAKVDYLAGNMYFDRGDFEDAQPQFQNAAGLWPDYPDAHYGLANTLVREGHLNDAIAEYQKALEIQPDYPEADNNLAFIFLQADKVDEAIKYFQKASELQNNYQMFYNLGYAYRMNKMAPEAETNWEKAIQLQPQYIPAQINLSWTLATWPDAGARDGARALALAENLVQRYPDDPKILRTLAAADAETGHFSEAVNAAKKAESIAQSQSQDALARELQTETALYQSHTPFRSFNN